MPSDTIKNTLFAAWVAAVCIAVLAFGSPSVPNWVAAACMAIVPPLIVRHFWRTPEQTTTERIDEARR